LLPGACCGRLEPTARLSTDPRSAAPARVARRARSAWRGRRRAFRLKLGARPVGLCRGKVVRRYSCHNDDHPAQGVRLQRSTAKALLGRIFMHRAGPGNPWPGLVRPVGTRAPVCTPHAGCQCMSWLRSAQVNQSPSTSHRSGSAEAADRRASRSTWLSPSDLANIKIRHESNTAVPDGVRSTSRTSPVASSNRQPRPWSSKLIPSPMLRFETSDDPSDGANAPGRSPDFRSIPSKLARRTSRHCAVNVWNRWTISAAVITEGSSARGDLDPLLGELGVEQPPVFSREPHSVATPRGSRNVPALD